MVAEIVEVEDFDEETGLPKVYCPFCGAKVYYIEGGGAGSRDPGELDLHPRGVELKVNVCPHLLFEYCDTIGRLNLIRRDFYELYRRAYGEDFDPEMASRLFDGVVYKWTVEWIACGPASMTSYVAFTREEQASELLDIHELLKE